MQTVYSAVCFLAVERSKHARFTCCCFYSHTNFHSLNDKLIKSQGVYSTDLLHSRFTREHPFIRPSVVEIDIIRPKPRSIVRNPH